MTRPTRPISAMLAALSISWLACTFTGARIDEPAVAAQDWFAAVATMDALKADEMVCQAEREAFRDDMATGGALFGAFEWLVGPMEVEIDLSKVDFSTLEQRGDWAIVAAKGEMRAAIGGSVNSEEIDEAWFMTLEDGEWRWCGEVHPGTQVHAQELASGSDQAPPYGQAMLAIKSIESFRTEGRFQAYVKANNEESTSHSEGLFALPNQARTFTQDNDGSTFESTQAGGTRCTRRNDEEWACVELTGDYEDFRENPFQQKMSSWTMVVLGRLAFPEEGGAEIEILDHRYTQDVLEGEQCHLFHLGGMTKSATYESSWSMSLCFGRDSFDPVLLLTEQRSISQGEVISSTVYVERYSDINEPFDIVMPSP